MNIGSLCTGYGGLDMALDGDTVWVSDIDKHAAKLLAHRFPTVPNLGDLTAVDWEAVEPVDIITAGYPCQPFSHAGKREGQNDERHIWPHIANAVRVLRPRYAVFENVAGHVSLGLATVLGDLAAIGFDAEWTTVRASDVGAPHRRERVFILAVNRDTNGGIGDGWRTSLVHVRSELDKQASPQPTRTDRPPTNTQSDGRDKGWLESTRLKGRSDVTERGILASPNTEGNEQREPANALAVRGESGNGVWGNYFPAIQRWEHTIGCPAPNPTTTSGTGRTVLDPRFVEWMMGLPAGWVTDVPGISRTGQLHLLGNGVVPQQAQQALAILADQAVAA